MVKKLLSLTFGLLLSLSAMAQYENPMVPQSAIQFWTGTGSNRAVVAITWNDATAGNIGIAWGVQWNGNNVTAGSLMDTIAAYDSRLTVSGNTASWITNFTYVDAELGLNLVGPSGWWWYNWKASDGTPHSSSGVSADIMVNGDFLDWLPMDEDTYASYPADTMIMATDPNGASLPEESTIAASEILYWVGEGSNQVVMAVNWADTALAWGYRFNGTKSVSDMLNDIATADPRFSIEIGQNGLDDIVFVVAPGDTLRKQAYSYWESKNNGAMDAGMGQPLNDGDFEKWAEPAAGIVVDSTYWEAYSYWSYTYVYTMDIHPVSAPAGPMPEESTIAASEILYWVGEGSKQVVMAVNWADTALAWGYRFNGAKSVSDMLNDIAAADPRFSIEIGEHGLDDIVFVVAPGDTLRKQAYSYWESKNNGVMDAGMGQPLNDGDFEKWAEPAAGIVVDSTYWEAYSYWSYTYVYTMEIHPVSVPQTENINSIDAVSINVYPNPASHMVTISGANDNSEAVLYDMLGSTVATYKVNGTESKIDLSNVTNGVYLLRIDGKTVRLVVRH